LDYEPALFYLTIRFENIWEQMPLQVLDCAAVRPRDRVYVHFERGFNGSVAELLLSDLGRNAKVMQQRRMNVAQLMPRHAADPCGLRSRMERPG